MRKINIPETINQVTSFIKQSVRAAGFSKCIVAVSGGVDSAVSVSLAVRALGKENTHAVLLPYKNWHEEAKTHARLVLKNLKISEKNIHEVNIGPLVDSFVSILNNPTLPPLKLRGGEEGLLEEAQQKQLLLGNIMARVRMIILYDLARKLSALVIGTENKSEHYLGYFTRFGDEASDIEPIRNIYKTEVFGLATHLGVPEEIITKAPTAGLWHGQTDEGEFGFTYKEADEVIYGLFEQKLTKADLIKQGLNPKVIDKVESWVSRVDFKHHLPLIASEPVSKIN